MVDQSAPSAISLIVKSYSLRQTKSSAAQASMLSTGAPTTLALMKPILAAGFRARIIVAVLQSDLKLGVEVWITMKSWDFTSSSMSLNDRRCGGVRQPGRIPERTDLALHLVARARAAVITVERRGLEEKSLHSQAPIKAG